MSERIISVICILTYLCKLILFVSWTCALEAVLKFCDHSSACWQIPVSEEWRKLKTFHSVGEKKFSDKQGFLVSMERDIVFYKKISQMFWFLFECGLPFATPADSIHYLLCMWLFKSGHTQQRNLN